MRSNLYALLLALTVPLAAHAQQQKSCNDCEFAECIRNTIRQKEQLKDVYSDLAGEWGRLYVRVDADDRRTPLATIDLEERPKGKQVLNTWTDLNAKLAAYERRANELTSMVPTPEGCGYGGDAISIDTLAATCKINMPALDKFARIAPCRELYAITAEHEGWHAQQCQARKGNRHRPAILLTPGGHALEEVAAYEQEIGKLRKLLSGLEGRQIEIDGTATVPRRRGVSVRTTATISLATAEDDTITGNGELREEWEAPVAPCRIVQAPPVAVKVTAQRDGDELVFRTHFPPGMKPGFIIHCPNVPPIQTAPPGAPLGIFGDGLRVRDEDGAESAYDYATPTSGQIKGQMLVRLRKCAGKRN